MAPLLARRPACDRTFERLYRRHAGDVYRYALALLRDPTEAEDATQTAFMNAYRALVGGEEPRAPKAWLLAIVHNVCRMRRRSLARRPREVPLDDHPIAAVDDERPNLDVVLAALAELPLNQRAALVMREVEGRSYREIAEVLDVSTSAVEALIFRARRRLRVRRDALGALAAAPLPASLEHAARRCGRDRDRLRRRAEGSRGRDRRARRGRRRLRGGHEPADGRDHRPRRKHAPAMRRVLLATPARARVRPARSTTRGRVAKCQPPRHETHEDRRTVAVRTHRAGAPAAPSSARTASRSATSIAPVTTRPVTPPSAHALVTAPPRRCSPTAPDPAPARSTCRRSQLPPVQVPTVIDAAASAGSDVTVPTPPPVPPLPEPPPLPKIP